MWYLSLIIHLFVYFTGVLRRTHEYTYTTAARIMVGKAEQCPG